VTSWDEARRCPKCKEPGRDARRSRGPKRSTVHLVVCENKRCSWYDTTWVVQVMADGSIPIRKPGLPEYPSLSGSQEAMARRVLEDLEFERTRQEPTPN
jgi:hypothetical protein